MPHDPMTLAEFEREVVEVILGSTRIDPRVSYDGVWSDPEIVLDDNTSRQALRPLILRLLAGERERIIMALPGGYMCEPQAIADMIREMGDA